MKAKHPTLPPWIVKQQNGRYRNMKTLAWVSLSQLAISCHTEPVNSELKHERIMQSRWDLKQD